MSRQSRLARLAKMAQPNLERRRRAESNWRLTALRAVEHAAVLAFITEFGDPSIDEPLSAACQRCEETETWARCCKEFPISLRWRHDTFPFNPHDGTRASRIGSVLRYMLIADLPGADEREKLNAVFAAAPPWLLYFSFADYTAKLLNLSLPDLSNVRCFERSRADFERWPGLPDGIFECRPWPNGAEVEPLAHTELKLPGQPVEPDLRHMTPRQRKRALATYMKPQEYEQRWPPLLPVEYLKDPWEFLKRQRQASDQRRLREA